ncbi:2-succinyl-6-hydroxy-2,4-cyclohexadiene-1-carboxylate synthase [Rouxiella sp. S1S-2]|uniref:2-succinyl-6-hydroxy-2, 4-cyclohexadiene-1-carboxylate synthase n=1 Tax=Rouxiella sp. S1S-2 TaxID=2653856 RepID=UPI00126583DA|nr:2-succinyl-6-hydroxy-2,4-cyclohexadiene-1-carboxylate synthase [Rouxiella sp. S1S-2]KAB7895918.1 2-succinyl-6-hydroxy-2,4-cyclohexadiene-1-carboxylate synthase [Rouxiella sp. S1S-2]
MTLSCTRIDGGSFATTRPWLVFLHGFLGNGSDWYSLLNHLSHWRCLLVDLPGHGASAHLTAAGFADLSHQLCVTLKQHNISQYWLIGYSLGGRVALYHACCGENSGLQGLVIEGGHPGLETLLQRQSRQQCDCRWREKLQQMPLQNFLTQWYRQPVFHDLSAAQRCSLIQLRLANDPQRLAAIFTATSLALQPDLRPQIRKLRIPYLWLCGSEDEKFLSLIHRSNLPHTAIEGAGHNAHRAQAALFANRLTEFISLNRLKENRDDPYRRETPLCAPQLAGLLG